VKSEKSRSEGYQPKIENRGGGTRVGLAHMGERMMDQKIYVFNC
jgi:hypothetical protein